MDYSKIIFTLSDKGNETNCASCAFDGLTLIKEDFNLFHSFLDFENKDDQMIIGQYVIKLFSLLKRL